MNVKELIGKYEYMSHACFRRVDTLEVLKDLRQLDEPQKVTVLQFVADWYEENKDSFEANLYRFVCNLTSIFDGAKLNEFERWFLTAGTKPFQTLVNMHQFGYEVEEEKRYLVRMKSIREDHETLNCDKISNKWNFSSEKETTLFRTKHTRKQLEEAGFGWVFDCEGIDIEECLVELCQLVFDEMIFCQAAVSRTYFATLPTDNPHIMSEARKELPFKPKQEMEE